MTDRELMQQALEALEFHVKNADEIEEIDLVLVTALRERLEQPEQDWDWRHPKAQALIGAKARLEITLRLVEQLLEDPHFETTASDMEYWEPLHDKLQERLAQPVPPVLTGIDCSCGKKWRILNNTLTASEPETVMAEYKHQTYAAYKTDGEMKIGVVPVQEPVAWMYHDRDTGWIIVQKEMRGFLDHTKTTETPLYTAPQPRQWQGLTDEELEQVFPAIATYHEANKTLYRSIARAIEAKLREKNHG